MSAEEMDPGVPTYDSTVINRSEMATGELARLASNTTKAPYSSASFDALYHTLEGSTDQLTPEAIQQHRQAFLGLVALRPNYTPLNIAREYQRCLQASILWRKKAHAIDHDVGAYDDDLMSFPAGMTSATRWYPHIEAAVAQPINYGIFQQFLRMHTNSNIGSRGAAVLLEQAIRGRKGEYSMAEFGTACLGIAKKLRMHKDPQKPDLRFASVSVNHAYEAENGNMIYIPDKTLSTRVGNTIRTYPVALGFYIGFDMQDSRDAMVGAKSMGSSFYTEELADPNQHRLKEWNALESIVPTQHDLRFELADVSKKLDLEDLYKRHPELKDGVDVTLGSFIAYELQPDKIANLQQNMLAITKDTGVAILIDEASIEPDGTMTLNNDWGKFGTRVMIYDKTLPELGWQTYFTAENGRLRRIVGEKTLERFNYDQRQRLGIQVTRH